MFENLQYISLFDNIIFRQCYEFENPGRTKKFKFEKKN